MNNYKPTMSRRKLAKTVLITDRNYQKVMGEINRFLNGASIMKLCGLCPKIIGQEIIEYDGVKYPRNIYSEEMFPNYVPFVGECTYHSLRNHAGLKDLRLAISSPWEENCTPISVGDRYKIFGDRLVIMSKYDKYVNKTPWLRYHEFLRLPEPHAEEKILQYKRSGLISSLSEYDVWDALSYVARDSETRAILHSKMDRIEDEIEKHLKNMTKGTCKFNVSEDIVFHVDLDSWMKDGEKANCYYFTVSGSDNKVRTVFNAVVQANKSWIDERNKEYESSEPEDDWDWDEYPEFDGEI